MGRTALFEAERVTRKVFIGVDGVVSVMLLEGRMVNSDAFFS